jgi:hypothetical protein
VEVFTEGTKLGVDEHIPLPLVKIEAFFCLIDIVPIFPTIG